MIPIVYLSILIDTPFLATMSPYGWRTIGYTAAVLSAYLLYAELEFRIRKV